MYMPRNGVVVQCTCLRNGVVVQCTFKERSSYTTYMFRTLVVVQFICLRMEFLNIVHV